MNKNLQSPLKLSLCLIVKNEKDNLPRCLNSAKSYVDEIIVVDTGSEDGTPEIAAQYGAKVYYFQWCDDFAAARNYAISQATGDWILMLDADEELIVESPDFFNEITSNSENMGFFIKYIEMTDGVELTPSYRLSLFQNISDFRYVGRFQEELIYENSANVINDSIKHLTSIKVFHYGFQLRMVRQKNISRNIPILERIRQEEGLSLRLLYSLAEMYINIEQVEKAKECYAEAFDRLLPNLIDGNPPKNFFLLFALLYSLGVQSLSENDYETARLICQRGLEWCTNHPSLNYLAGATLRALGFPLGAIAYFENCIRLGQDNSYYNGEPFEVVFITTYPAYDMGCVYISQSRTQEALTAFEMALSFDANFIAAREKIEEIKKILATEAKVSVNKGIID